MQVLLRGFDADEKLLYLCTPSMMIQRDWVFSCRRNRPSIEPAGLHFDVEQERRGAPQSHPKLIAKRQLLLKNSGCALRFDILEFLQAAQCLETAPAGAQTKRAG